jgi:CheY-like chemotaxis protein
MQVVLVVEDNSDLRSLLVEMLACLGYDARAASSAKAGLASLLRGDVDVVITDWMLGDATGGSMLEQAQAAGVLADVGVIIYSASSSASKPKTLPRALLVPKASSVKTLLESVACVLPRKVIPAQRSTIASGGSP